MGSKSKPATRTSAAAANSQALIARPFTRLLIANRGEIACRIMRTARQMGLETIAVFSEADRNAQHVRRADEAICIGAAPAAESYLDVDKIVAAARASNAQAVHPGYGFLSENAALAAACAANGVVFVGPSRASISAMASKSAARALMLKAGVPVVPGYHDRGQSNQALSLAADRIGYPIIIKPSAGGGGKGMRIVHGANELGHALQSARSEAMRSFGDELLIIEKYVERARHIEVQVFGDTHGHIVSLFERDCTLQRRHQKVIEEAPAPTLGAAERKTLGETALAAARAIDYVGAGTVEFIFDRSSFYFLEMNTRLQVEHAVTEMITGIDLVEWQLRVAMGEHLPLEQADIRAAGHAIEARIYAEDPDHDLLPSTGRIVRWIEPEIDSHIRIDSGFAGGDVVTQYYDPLLAKVIACGDTREIALARLDRALRGFQIAGVEHNISLLREIARHPAVETNDIDTRFIERYLGGKRLDLEDLDLAAACAAVLAREQQNLADAPPSPWRRSDGWMMVGVRRRTMVFRRREMTHEVVLRYLRTGMEVDIDGRAYHLSFVVTRGGSFDIIVAERKLSASAAWADRILQLSTARGTFRLELMDPYQGSAAEVVGGQGLTAPMSGTVIRIVAEAGSRLDRGSAILVIESMKMEHLLRAPSTGRLSALRCAVGDFVQQGFELADFETEPDEADT